MTDTKTLILASKSPSRAMVLEGAGVTFDIIPSAVDEAALKEGAQNLAPTELAKLLARKKALQVSKQNPGRIVLGADQILAFEGKIFDKPKDMNEARKTLKRLRGKTHTLISCTAFAADGKVIAEFSDEAHLTMADFSDGFLEDYLKDAGEKILSSVGAYQLEAEGARLFEKVEGDFFTILGLPITPILEFLSEQGLLKS